MIADEYQKQHESLKKLVALTYEERLAEFEKEESQYMEEEAEDELNIDLPPEKPMKGYGVELPSDDTVVSWYPDGTPRSYFRDPRWEFHVGHVVNSIGFGHVHENLGLDLSGKLCTPLVKFVMLICYFLLPGNDPRAIIAKYRTTITIHSHLLHLCFFLKEKGFLYGKQGEFRGLSTLSADELKEELLSRIEHDENNRGVSELVLAIRAWITVSSLVELPVEFAAPFSEKQLWDGGLMRKIVKYRASKLKAWDVIEFDDLVQMFKTARKYMENYIDDVLFIGSIFDRLFAEDMTRPAGQTVCIRPYGCTKEMVKEILGRQYAIDPETGAAWFTPHMTNSKTAVDKAYLRGPVGEMVSVCVFLLFIWTAMRKMELVTLEVSALLVDGKPLGSEQSAIEQVRRGSAFALTRVVTKTNKEHKGEKKKVPLPRSGAEAFAVLVDLYHKGRQATGNPFLLPNGDFGHARGVNYSPGKIAPVCCSAVYKLVHEYCDLAGVKHYHPHRCRKTIATILINHDPTCIELIRELLCHEDIEMTRRYLMDLPGIAEDARKLFVASQSEAIVEIITSAIEGKFAGAAGDRASEAILANTEAFKGKRLPQTISALEKTLIKSNFIVVHTQTSWCLRFEARVPWDAPCLPPPSKRQSGELAVPNFEKCQEWLCKFSGYTPSDIGRARQGKKWAEKMKSSAASGASRAYFDQMAKYWDQVIDQLENGRPEILGLHLVDAALAMMDAHA